MASIKTGEAVNLARFGNVVPEGYEYYKKVTTPGEDLALPNGYLKWYDLYPTDEPITPEQDAETRAFIRAEVAAGRLDLGDDLGFVILHRAGNYLLLLITTWRNTNEMWESVYFKKIGQDAQYVLNEFPSTHRATYCVWELGAVWHERDAWVRFLSSKRDEQAKQEYITSKFNGMI